MSVRLTLNRFPSSAGLKDTIGLPWGAVVRPFAPLKEEVLIPPDTVIRCANCFAYMNTFNSFDRKRWQCSLCHYENVLEARYATYSGRNNLPELNNHVYEIDVDEDKEQDPEVDEAVFVALVDLTGGGSYLELIKSALLSTLEAVGEGSRFALLTFSDKLGLYNLRSEIPHVQYVRLPASGECELGLEEIMSVGELAVPVGEFKENISTAVDSLVSLMEDEDEHSLAGGNPGQQKMKAALRRGLGIAVQTVVDFMNDSEELPGVRLLTFLSGIPNHGLGALDQNRYAVDRDINESNRDLLAPATSFYRDLGERAGASGVCIDLFVVSNRYTDLASIKFLSMMTGGHLMLYETWENATLPQDIFRQLSGKLAWKGLLRFRTSPEFEVSRLFGAYTADENYTNLFHVSCVSEKQTLSVDFEFTTPSGFPIDPDMIPTVQIAFAYTHFADGYARRRLRIMTFQVGVAHAPAEIYDTADATIVTTLLMHKIVRASLDEGIPEARTLLEDWLVILLRNYNDTFTRTDRPVDLEFSNSRPMQGLTRLVFGMMKNPILAAENVHPDERIYLQHLYGSLRPEYVARSMYPAMIAYANDEERLTDGLALSKASLDANKTGIFILDSFSKIYVYYGAQSESKPPSAQDSELRNECNRLKGDRIVTPRVVNVKEGDPDSRYFDLQLIEEEVRGKPYSEFTEAIRNRVCTELHR